jgi:hypothetical protein
MLNIYIRHYVILIVARFDAYKVFIRRSFADRLLCITVEYKLLIALSLLKILLSSSFLIEQIVLNNML